MLIKRQIKMRHDENTNQNVLPLEGAKTMDGTRPNVGRGHSSSLRGCHGYIKLN